MQDQHVLPSVMPGSLAVTALTHCRALYQSLTDPEADTGQSMQLPYLLESKQTMECWKAAFVKCCGQNLQPCRPRAVRLDAQNEMKPVCLS